MGVDYDGPVSSRSNHEDASPGRRRRLSGQPPSSAQRKTHKREEGQQRLVGVGSEWLENNCCGYGGGLDARGWRLRFARTRVKVGGEATDLPG